MPMFVHLAPEKVVRHVARTGLQVRRSRDPAGRVVFAFPVLPSWFLSHQWLRELKRRGQRTLVAVHFRIPDEEPVTVGRYGKPHRSMTAAQAVAFVASLEDSRGYEVLIPRRIAPGEIHAVRSVNQVVGWRYYPNAHGRTPCGCDACQRGDFGAKKVRIRWRARMSGGLESLPITEDGPA